MSITLYDFQETVLSEISGAWRSGAQAVMLVMPTGCHAEGSEILMHDGSVKRVEDILIGDTLMGPDGQPRRVLRLHRGVDDLYRIKPHKGGEPFVVNGGHVLSLYKTSEGRDRPHTGQITNISVNDYIDWSKTQKHINKLRRVSVDFPERNTVFKVFARKNGNPIPEENALGHDFTGFPITPYFMGIFLGDGGAMSGAITTADDEIVDAVYQEADRFGLRVRREPMPGNAASNFFIVSESCGPYQNRYKSALRSAGVFSVTCKHKRIPFEYLVSSRTDRLETLAGLIDSDGYKSKTGYDFVFASQRLRDDLCFLARSLGFSASKSEKVTNKATYYRVYVGGSTHEIPCRVARKKMTYSAHKKNHLLSGFSVDPIGLGSFYGFEVDVDHLYLTGDFTVHHNSGKTTTFSEATARAVARGKRVLTLVHRRELLKQTSKTLQAFGLQHGVISAGSSQFSGHAVQVASVQTLVRRLGRLSWQPDFIIVDECHHATGKTSWGKVLAAYPSARVLGVTATPERLDGQGLGRDAGGFFDAMVIGPSVAELTARGYLSPARVFAPSQQVDLSGVRSRAGDFAANELAAAMDKPTITGSAVSEYRKRCDGEPAIAFCASVAHAEHVAESFREAGYQAASIDGSLDQAVRARRIADLGSGALQVLTSCDIISEGTDIPVVAAAILLRPTQSLALCLQQMGRALRVFPGKSHATILDHVGNCFRHGLPSDERDWSLAGRPKKKGRKKEDEALPVRQCNQCYAIHTPAPTCPHCGYVYPVRARKVDEVAGELSEIEKVLAQRKAKQAQAHAQTLEDLVCLAKARGYKNPRAWAGHVWKARQQRGAVA